MTNLPFYEELHKLPAGIYRIQVREKHNPHYIGSPNTSIVNDLAAQGQVWVTYKDVGVKLVIIEKNAPVEDKESLIAAKAWLLMSFHSHRLKWVWCEEDQMYMLVVLPTKEGKHEVG